MTENKPNEYVKDRELIVDKVQYEINRNPPRLVIETNLGRITCKPKKESKEMVKGMEIINSVPMDIDDLPQKIFDIIKVINEKGCAKVTAAYVVMTTEVDGKEMQYRFLNSVKQLDNWELVTEEAKHPAMVDYGASGVNFKQEKRKQLEDQLKSGELNTEQYLKALEELD